MIEYTLLLIISVGLVLMVMYKIFQPLQGFLKSYMGDYVACLLETGELPAIGGDSTIAKDEGCNSNFQPGTLKAGRPYKGSDNSASNGKGDKSKEDGNQAGNDSKSGSGGGGGGGGGSGGHIFGQRGSPAGDVVTHNSKVTEFAVSGNSSNGFFSGSQSGNRYRGGSKERSIFLSGLTEEERKKLEKKQESSTRVIAAEGRATPSKKSEIKPPPSKIIEMPDDQPMTIGNFIRILFIAAIIIALVIFIGGQVLQMSKNSE